MRRALRWLLLPAAWAALIVAPVAVAQAPPTAAKPPAPSKPTSPAKPVAPPKVAAPAAAEEEDLLEFLGGIDSAEDDDWVEFLQSTDVKRVAERQRPGTGEK